MQIFIHIYICELNPIIHKASWSNRYIKYEVLKVTMTVAR